MRTIGRWSVASFISVVLSFCRFGFALGLVITVFLTSALPFITAPAVTVTVPVSFTLDTLTPIRTGQPGFGFEFPDGREQAKPDRKGHIDRVNGSLKIPTTSKRFIAVNAAILLIIMSFMLFVLDQLHAVFQTLIHGKPFVPENARRIRWVALAVIGGELARSVIVLVENYYAITHVTIAGLTFDAWPHVDFSTIGYGLIILVIAEVFRAGTRLDEEQSLTI